MPKQQQLIPDSEKKLKNEIIKLEEKAKKPKNLTLKDFIQSVQTRIENVLKAGYSYEDVAKIMQAEGIEVAATTIRTYLPPKSKRKTSGDTTGEQSTDNTDIQPTATQGETTTKPKSNKKSKSSTSSDSPQTESTKTQVTTDNYATKAQYGFEPTTQEPPEKVEVPT